MAIIFLKDNFVMYQQNPLIISEVIQIHYSGHPLSRTPTGPAKRFEIVNVRDSGKSKFFAFYKALGKPNTVFTPVLTLVSLQDNRREKIYRYF